MKAVIIKRDGFRKYITVEKKVYEFCTIDSAEICLYPYGSKAWEKHMSKEIPIRRYVFEREYNDEFDNRVLIYKGE